MTCRVCEKEDCGACKICKGTGELNFTHPDSSPSSGRRTGASFPEVTGGCTGEIISDPNRSFCSRCKGSGVEPF